MGTTSACAENTWSKNVWLGYRRNYLRVRGEYAWRDELTTHTEELPPRARRIRHVAAYGEVATGTTSACAENTGDRVQSWAEAGNYLRVRGEYRFRFRVCVRLRGTTSACAENTLNKQRGGGVVWNYLRVRGEYVLVPAQCWRVLELPPRARRIRLQRAHDLR